MNRIAKSIIIFALVCLTLMAAGCDKRTPKQKKKEQLLTYFKDNPHPYTLIHKITTHNHMRPPEYTPAYDSYKLWNNNQIDPEPTLISATLNLSPDESTSLSLCFTDEDTDTLGFRIVETLIRDPNHIIADEKYPIFINNSLPPFINFTIPVRLRTDNQIKNETQWANYITDPDIEEIPDIYLTKPRDPNITTQIILFDKNNNYSNSLKPEIRKFK